MSPLPSAGVRAAPAAAAAGGGVRDAPPAPWPPAGVGRAGGAGRVSPCPRSPRERGGSVPRARPRRARKFVAAPGQRERGRGSGSRAAGGPGGAGARCAPGSGGVLVRAGSSPPPAPRARGSPAAGGHGGLRRPPGRFGGRRRGRGGQPPGGVGGSGTGKLALPVPGPEPRWGPGKGASRRGSAAAPASRPCAPFVGASHFPPMFLYSPAVLF